MCVCVCRWWLQSNEGITTTTTKNHSFFCYYLYNMLQTNVWVNQDAMLSIFILFFFYRSFFFYFTFIISQRNVIFFKKINGSVVVWMLCMYEWMDGFCMNWNNNWTGPFFFLNYFFFFWILLLLVVWSVCVCVCYFLYRNRI